MRFSCAIRVSIRLVLSIFLVSCLGCNAKHALVGKWIKISSEFCTLAQRNELEFFDDGTYVGALPNWKGGTYRVVTAVESSWKRRPVQACTSSRYPATR